MRNKKMKNGRTPESKKPLDHPGDQIDIAATEGSQRWHIAEKMDKVAKR